MGTLTFREITDQEKQNTRCGNCGRLFTDGDFWDAWSTVIDWRTDYLCPRCHMSYVWSDSDWRIDRANRVYRRKGTDDDLWRDAYYIAHVGASNANAVDNCLQRHTATWGSDHPAVRAIRGHLAFLRGESLGPEIEDLKAVERNAYRLGLISSVGVKR